ncbi:MAG TPA: GAF domain-containing protein [Ktedonobacteraceae bacterium]|nr:GAF domain-containing protein [Ktedonobacteraceae bacterium]
MQQQPEDIVKALATAQETIERQAKEIDMLRRQAEHEQFAQTLRKLLLSARNTNVILAPFTRAHLLEMVVTTAAQVISARSGSLFLIDEKAQDLVFEVAIGPAAQEVKKFRVPLGHGIAGMVALSGQPMAIADAAQAEQFAFDIATSVNYIPRSILCVPLFYDNSVIGAIELLDKSEKSSFSPQDIETLGAFANIAAVAIAQSQAYEDEQAMLNALLAAFGEGSYQQVFARDAAAFASWMQTADSTHDTARELALLVHELLLAGNQEGELCKNILQGFVFTLRSRKKEAELLSA